MATPSKDNSPAAQAARRLWAHWQSGQVLNALPQVCRPWTPAQGYASQAELPTAAGRDVVCWKIAATSAHGQQHIQVDGPLAGRLLSGDTVSADLGRLGHVHMTFAAGPSQPPSS